MSARPDDENSTGTRPRFAQGELGWASIRTWKPGIAPRFVTLWLDISPSARSMGWGDAFAVRDCWHEKGHWFHIYRGSPARLERDYITHWTTVPPDDLQNGPALVPLDWWRA